MFRMPSAVKITGRTSTITNSFVSAVIPVFMPSDDEVRQALSVLGMSAEEEERCAYCGDKATEWDHLRAIVRDKRPTGYVSEIANLVPACGKCNQSKGGRDWREWITSDARLSPRSREITNLDARIKRLDDFERWRHPLVINFETCAGAERWAKHWENHDRLLEMMRRCQSDAEAIRLIVKDATQPRAASTGV